MDICLTAILPSAVLELSNIRPFQRGFYCDDDTIKYPLKQSTVPGWAVGVIGLSVPVLTVSAFHIWTTLFTLFYAVNV